MLRDILEWQTEDTTKMSTSKINGCVIFTNAQKKVMRHLAEDPHVIEVTRICPDGDWAYVIYHDPEYGREDMMIGEPLKWEIEK